jgi:hypothetical protein
MVVLERSVEKRLRAERQASGADRYDEVWDGVYVMAPQSRSPTATANSAGSSEVLSKQRGNKRTRCP